MRVLSRTSQYRMAVRVWRARHGCDSPLFPSSDRRGAQEVPISVYLSIHKPPEKHLLTIGGLGPQKTGALFARKFCSIQWSRTCFETEKASVTRREQLNLFQQPRSCACCLSLVPALFGSISSLAAAILGADIWRTVLMCLALMSPTPCRFSQRVALSTRTSSHIALVALLAVTGSQVRWMACRSLDNGIGLVVTPMGNNAIVVKVLEQCQRGCST